MVSYDQTTNKIIISNVIDFIVQSKRFDDCLIYDTWSYLYPSTLFVRFRVIPIYFHFFSWISRPIPLAISLVPCGGLGWYMLFVCPCLNSLLLFLSVWVCNLYFLNIQSTFAISNSQGTAKKVRHSGIFGNFKFFELPAPFRWSAALQCSLQGTEVVIKVATDLMA